jgi:hypothetical protein
LSGRRLISSAGGSCRSHVVSGQPQQKRLPPEPPQHSKVVGIRFPLRLFLDIAKTGFL